MKHAIFCIIGAIAATQAMTTRAEADTRELGKGAKLAILHCGRCHVVPGGNPFGGIGSTPSFAVMRSYKDWESRFAAFYTEPPHVAVTQIEGVTEDFDPLRPSPIAPMVLKLRELEEILDFVATVEPKEVGRVE